MAIRTKVAVLGACGVVALGGAGLYAGALTTTVSGPVGAGSQNLQASCTTAVNVAPEVATWNATTQLFEYSVLDVTGTFNGCSGETATVKLYATSNGTPLSSGAHQISGPESTGSSFTVGLVPAVDAAIVDGNYKYGIVIQSAT